MGFLQKLFKNFERLESIRKRILKEESSNKIYLFSQYVTITGYLIVSQTRFFIQNFNHNEDKSSFLKFNEGISLIYEFNLRTYTSHVKTLAD